MFEIAKRIAVEQDKNGNHFRIAHSSLSIASFRGVWRGIWKRKCFFVQFQLIFFAEIICNTIDFRDFSDKFQEDCDFVIWLILNSKYTKNNPLFRLLLKLFWGKRRTAYPELGFMIPAIAALNISILKKYASIFAICFPMLFLITV